MNVRTRSREVGKALRRYVTGRIATGQLQPGDKLPTERELVDMFGGARSTVRRVLEELEAEGVVGREVGRGTFVKKAAPASSGQGVFGSTGLPAIASLGAMQPDLSTISRIASPADVMELRLMLEPLVIERAVSRASPAEIDGMFECLDQASKAQTLEEFEHWDDMLHRTFAAASRNPLFIAIYAMVGAVRLEAQWGELKRRTLTDELKRRHFDEHVRIVNAVRDRDARAARAEMKHHLDHIQSNMFGMAEERSRHGSSLAAAGARDTLVAASRG